MLAERAGIGTFVPERDAVVFQSRLARTRLRGPFDQGDGRGAGMEIGRMQGPVVEEVVDHFDGAPADPSSSSGFRIGGSKAIQGRSASERAS